MVVGRWAGVHAVRLHEVAHVLLARDGVDHVGGGEEERALRHDDALLRGEQLLERHLERVDPLPLELLEILRGAGRRGGGSWRRGEGGDWWLGARGRRGGAAARGWWVPTCTSLGSWPRRQRSASWCVRSASEYAAELASRSRTSCCAAASCCARALAAAASAAAGVAATGLEPGVEGPSGSREGLRGSGSAVEPGSPCSASTAASRALASFAWRARALCSAARLARASLTAPAA